VYPQALLAAAKIAPDAPTVATNLNRIVLEYGASPWADDALLLLTQLYFAQRDPAQTIQAAERLRHDYPDSPLRYRVAFPAARAYFELKNEARAASSSGSARRRRRRRRSGIHEPGELLRRTLHRRHHPHLPPRSAIASSLPSPRRTPSRCSP